ncbi:hypothetical protein B0H14DRAFT_3761693 [Mycena olivaceomarginata]|nr:hypothetical protein B0H14DRAFT_3761693 [Mycena olivaceomarginata]
MYHFCALADVSQEAIASVLQLLRLDYPQIWEQGCIAHIHSEWLSQALESVGSLTRDNYFKFVGHLWQALFLLSPDLNTLSIEFQRVLLSVLSIDDDDPGFDQWEEGRVAYFACGILDSKSANQWFSDTELSQILQQYSVWANLGLSSWCSRDYLSLGHTLSGATEWKEIIAGDLPGWLGQWPNIMQPSRKLNGKEITERDCTQFRNVLALIWEADETEANEFGVEATLVMVFSTLAKAWDQAQPVDWGIKQFWYHIKLLDSTVVAIFSARIQFEQVLVPSQCFQDIIITRLGQELAQAGQYMKQDNSRNLKNIAQELANLVLRVGLEVPDQLRIPPLPGTDDLEYWDDLRGTWINEVHVLRNRIEEVSTSLAVQQGDSVFFNDSKSGMPNALYEPYTAQHIRYDAFVVNPAISADRGGNWNSDLESRSNRLDVSQRGVILRSGVEMK